jgi:hypothetical protein
MARDKIYTGVRREPDGGKLLGFLVVGPVDGRCLARQWQIVWLSGCRACRWQMSGPSTANCLAVWLSGLSTADVGPVNGKLSGCLVVGPVDGKCQARRWQIVWLSGCWACRRQMSGPSTANCLVVWLSGCRAC